MSVRRRHRGWLRFAAVLVGGFVIVTIVAPPILESFRTTGCPKWHFDVNQLESALNDFAADHDGRYPHELVELLAKGSNGSQYYPATRIKLDAWQHDYRYAEPLAPGDVPRVWSMGPDGIDGTGDDLGRGDEGHEVELRPSR